MSITDSISRPTLLVDEKKVKGHIIKMANHARANGATLRPHFKTHQSGLIGQWFKECGIDQITVSSVEMAHYFFQHGWTDITIAFPLNPREIDAINRLLAFDIKLNLIVESDEVVQFLSDHLQHKAGVLIKLDSGARRTGIPMENEDQILRLCHLIQSLPNLLLKGFLTHAGHTYHSKSKNEINDIVVEAYQRMSSIRKAVGNEELSLSWGDTPSCSMLQELRGFDEWRPGNFVFYDVMQYHIGSCELQDVAVAMACPVVAVHHSRNQLVVHGGSVHFSSEFIHADSGFRLYGYIVTFNESGWSSPVSGAWMKSLSQEHGIIQLPDGMTFSFQPGDIIGVLPIHSCLTVHAMGRMKSLQGQLITCFR